MSEPQLWILGRVGHKTPRDTGLELPGAYCERMISALTQRRQIRRDTRRRNAHEVGIFVALKSALTCIIWVVKDRSALRPHRMPDHAGDRYAVRRDPGASRSPPYQP